MLSDNNRSSNFSFLSLIIFVFLFLLQDIRVILGQDDELGRRYAACARNFTCGHLISISYPFWGNERPNYCGIPDYKLDCLDDGVTTEIDIATEKYRVLEINQANNIMTITRTDILDDDDACLDDGFDATNLNFSLFEPTGGVVNVTLYYGCPPFPGTNGIFPNKFTCQTNETSNTDAYFYFAGGQRPPNSDSCRKRIEVPVMGASLARLPNASPRALSSIMKEGFNVSYSGAADSISRCYKCVRIGGECRYNSATAPNLSCFCPSNVIYGAMCSNAIAPGPGRKANVLRKIGIGVASAMGASILLALLVWILYIRYLRKKSSSDSNSIERFWKEEAANNGHQKIEAFVRDYGSLAAKRFKYKDVKKIINCFKEKLGQGGYGSVFKGQLHNGRLVAVKVLFSKSKNDGQEFINEVASISRTSHVNIVTLLGFCFDGNSRALIYEFMPNGSLDKFIYVEKQSSSVSGLMLGCETLYKVSIGIARGLEYLHRGCNMRILHFDIKPHNILLDEDFSPKIADFGLAKLCPGKESIISMLGARGTAGYIAPEVFSRNFGRISHKSDVYSYGMMVLEMVGGRKNIDVKVGMDHSSQLYFPHWIYDRLKLSNDLGLNEIMTEEREEATRKMVIVGLWCIQTNPSSRPSMSKVLEMLEGSAAALQIPPKPFLSSPPRSPPSSCSSSTISNS